MISHKSISRKHLVVEVGDVKPGDSVSLYPKSTAASFPSNVYLKARLDSRSRITLEDLGTKLGTLANGSQIRGQQHVLKGDRNEIKLGHYNAIFRFYSLCPAHDSLN